jgi:5-methylcytosine-specific restriction endonuclease McrA
MGTYGSTTYQQLEKQDCAKCDKEISLLGKKKTRAKRFCSFSCSEQYFSQVTRDLRYVRKIAICRYCKNEFEHTPKFKRLFCSRFCARTSFRKENARSTPNELARKSLEYKNWRIAVFTRDNFTCQNCEQIGNKLEAHHIHSFAKHKELRFDANNGITLCPPCHILADEYRRRFKTQRR